MNLILAAAAVITIAIPGVAPAQDTKPEKQKQVCRQTNPTGSRFKVRVCHTEAEWAEIDAATSTAADANGRASQPAVRR
ncbi:hypothetical protein FHT00_003341 [Sphingomonas insulae]|uniref:Uncharacterized protein n=1 Tax=Sphingomonas insulae TaxID=424800 RepID=A0ABN1HQ20_9SPHN|nr:hypothetical protein [Sphingomonas insulae]NIJ31362.1 hypothetical protein [Sphingomonas insulae]